jgi:hypothetical protein
MRSSYVGWSGRCLIYAGEDATREHVRPHDTRAMAVTSDDIVTQCTSHWAIVIAIYRRVLAGARRGESRLLVDSRHSRVAVLELGRELVPLVLLAYKLIK